jgi:hypothetical protein
LLLGSGLSLGFGASFVSYLTLSLLPKDANVSQRRRETPNAEPVAFFEAGRGASLKAPTLIGLS